MRQASTAPNDLGHRHPMRRAEYDRRPASDHRVAVAPRERCNSRPSASEIGRTNLIVNLQSETVAGRFEITARVPDP
jgi:hypothetical protein